MKRRMEQLINGRFEYEVPKLVLSETNIVVHTKTGENYQGELYIGTEDERRFKGMAMSSNRRIILAKEKFSGTTVCIPYAIEVKGLKPGDTMDGTITINSSLGEVQIPVHIEVKEEQIYTSRGEIKTLDEFVKLVQEDEREAFRLYTSGKFLKILQKEKEQILYQGLSHNPVTYQHMEEFLIAAGKKEPVQIQLEEKEKNFGNIQYTTKEKFQITRNTWGYTRIELEVLGDFISLEKQIITQDDFIGSVCNIEYLVRKDKLGKGRQYGAILLHTVYGTERYQIIASGEDPYDISNCLLEKNSMIRLVRAYEKYRLEDSSLEEWAEVAEKELEELKNRGCYYPVHQVMETFLLYKLKKEEKVDELLGMLSAYTFTEKEMEEEAAFLTLSCKRNIYEKEELLKAQERIVTLFRMNPGSRILMECVLATQSEYQTSHAKQLYVMEQVFSMGCTSPFLYLDAYEILKNEENQLRKLTPFIIQVLSYAAKHGKLTQELALRIGHLSEYEKNFRPVLYGLLKKCYEVYPKKDLVGNICKYIMKGNPVKKEYFQWYSLAVEYDIRITGLYEYYIGTMPKHYQPVLPQVIRMYFVYNNALSSKKRAAVYANVIRNKNIDKVTYQNYKKSMEEFAVKALKKGEISEDYVTIYQECIKKLENRSIAEKMTQIMYTHRVYCDDEKVRNVIVVHKELENEESFPCYDGVAYVRLYTKDAELFFEDDKQRRYAVTVDYNIQKLMDETVYKEQCMFMDIMDPGLLLSICGQEKEMADIDIRNLNSFQYAAHMEALKKEYRYHICGRILEYYATHADDHTLDSYIRQMDYLTFAKVNKVLLTELLIDKGMFDRAFAIISQYGYEGVSTDKLVKMVSRTILQTEFIEHEELVYLSLYLFEQGKYDDVILTYLSDNLMGPVEQMEVLWEHMQGFSLDTYALEEKILLLAMFGRVVLKQGDKILESYIRQKGKQQVIFAYLCFVSYGYFLGDESIDHFIVKCLENCYEKKWEIDKICRLALIKYYAEQKELSHKQMRFIKEILEECSESGLRFRFFRQLPECFRKSYQIDDKQFIEEKFSPDTKVTIHYCIVKSMEETPEYKSEPVKNMYQGIFVKEYLLFYGEILRYYLTVEKEEEVWTTEEKILTLEDTFQEGKTKYQLLNQMLSAEILKKEDQVEKSMREYLKREGMVQKLFPLIH